MVRKRGNVEGLIGKKTVPPPFRFPSLDEKPSLTSLGHCSFFLRPLISSPLSWLFWFSPLPQFPSVSFPSSFLVDPYSLIWKRRRRLLLRVDECSHLIGERGENEKEGSNGDGGNGLRRSSRRRVEGVKRNCGWRRGPLREKG